jgi:predicted ATPase
VEADGGDALSPLSPDDLAAKLRRAYVEWIEQIAAERPLVLALEDMQWADASTRELAEELLALTDRAPVLIVFTSRLEPDSEGWRLRVHVLTDYSHRAVELPLGPLSDDAAAELLGTLLPGVLDDAARREIVARAEGNPLYLEELMRALVEGGGLVRKRTWTLDIGAASRLIPPALEGLLVSRIDALPGDARRVAQVAAVVGRTFSVETLEHVLDPDLVSRELQTLLRAEIVREQRRYPELECTFRHGLLQQAALSTLTPERLRELHGRVAAAIEEAHADSLDEYLELLAAHYGRSDQLEKALEYLTRAVERANELQADTQASELLDRARRVAQRLGRVAPP